MKKLRKCQQRRLIANERIERRRIVEQVLRQMRAMYQTRFAGAPSLSGPCFSVPLDENGKPDMSHATIESYGIERERIDHFWVADNGRVIPMRIF